MPLYTAYDVYWGSVICVQLIHSSRSSEISTCVLIVLLLWVCFDGIQVICRPSRMGVRCYSVRMDSMSIFSKDNFTQ